MRSIYQIHVSIGKISKVINEASEIALKWNNSIEIGATEGIFQGNMPVIVGVEPLSTYIYLMQETKIEILQPRELHYQKKKNKDYTKKLALMIVVLV